ncbi:MAG: hypothetical protein JWO06_1445, partial [Bacteroidota bacterium]|nr:hypothetical protein [Bacteroidota bacterium]
DSLIKSLRRILLRKDASVEIQRVILSFANSTLTKQNIELKQWKALEAKLLTLSKNKVAAGSLNLFNYLVWTKAHTSNIKFAEAWKSIR